MRSDRPLHLALHAAATGRRVNRHFLRHSLAATAMEFALALVSELCGAARARDLGRSMVVPERSGADFGPRAH